MPAYEAPREGPFRVASSHERNGLSESRATFDAARMQFGRKSERLDRQIEQLELRLEELEADEGAMPVEIPKATVTVPEQAPRRPLPEHLPRDVQTAAATRLQKSSFKDLALPHDCVRNRSMFPD